MANHIPAIVVIAYNRPEPLQRLLSSIQKARYPNGTQIPIVISIDGGGEHNAAVSEIAQTFRWAYGEKEIINHSSNLGLIEHVFACGDLSQKFGSIILLEDDLFVGRSFYFYAQQGLNFFDVD
ncbi:MAG: glycosyltransferase family 2 protein, partial [Chloroflexota bacterium]